MKFIERLLRTEVAGIVAVLICACLVGLYGLFESLMWSLQGSKLIITPSNAAWLGFAYTGTIGVIGVLFYGAPVYALLSHKREVCWWVVVLAGAIPGTVMLPFEISLGSALLVGGVAVACITHLLSVKFISNEPAL